MMAAASVKNSCPSIPTIVQINNPAGGRSALWQSLAAFPNIQLLCVKQVKMSLLAGSCVCPGLHVLVSNMLQSFLADVDDPDSWHKECNFTLSHLHYSPPSDIYGATNALFPTVFSDYFHGKRFLDAAVELHAAIDVIPIAIFRRAPHTNQIEILLGPVDHIIGDGDLVYVLSRDLRRASLVARFPDCHRLHSSALTAKLIRCRDLTASFHMRPQKVSIVRSPIPEPSEKLPIAKEVTFQGHIVICGYVDASVIELVGAIRKQSLSAAIPIVIMFETRPPPDLHNTLGSFSALTILVGSLQDSNALEAASLSTANQIILLANPFAKAQSDVHDQVVKVDFDSIVSLLELENYLHGKTRQADTNMMVEILFLSNLRFIRPNFAYTPPALADLTSEMEGPRLPQLAAADGKVQASGLLQSIAAFSFYNPHIPAIIDALIYGSERRIVLVQIHDEFVGATYAVLVRRLADEYGVLTLGLFRGRSVRRSPVPYVFTKPPPTTIISADDRVYIVAPIFYDGGKAVVGRRTGESGKSLAVVMATNDQKQESLGSAIHLFQHAIRSPKARHSMELFEPDVPAWMRRIRSWWQAVIGEMDGSRWWKGADRQSEREPHDYREFMKGRNQRMLTTTMTMADPGADPDASQDEPHGWTPMLNGMNSAHLMSNSFTNDDKP